MMKDLHLHLSGSTDPVLLYEIISETGLKLRVKNFKEFVKSLTMRKDNVSDLDSYLEIIHIVDEAQGSPSAVERCFYKSYVDAYRDGCDYLELRWNPYKRSQNFKIDFDKLITGAIAGFIKAKSIYGVDGGQIFCLGRDIDSAANEGIFKKAIKYFNKGVIGIDIAGSEAKFPLKPEFAEYYKVANALGMMTTAHCGEEFYPTLEDSLATLIEKYKVQRIGHGVHIHRFPNLMKLAEKNNIMFEICITSNFVTQNVKSPEEYAKIFKIFEENNLKYTLCTDSTYPIGTTVVLEHQKYDKIMEIAKHGISDKVIQEKQEKFSEQKELKK